MGSNSTSFAFAVLCGGVGRPALIFWSLCGLETFVYVSRCVMPLGCELPMWHVGESVLDGISFSSSGVWRLALEAPFRPRLCIKHRFHSCRLVRTMVAGGWCYTRVSAYETSCGCVVGVVPCPRASCRTTAATRVIDTVSRAARACEFRIKQMLGFPDLGSTFLGFGLRGFAFVRRRFWPVRSFLLLFRSPRI